MSLPLLGSSCRKTMQQHIQMRAHRTLCLQRVWRGVLIHVRPSKHSLEEAYILARSSRISSCGRAAPTPAHTTLSVISSQNSSGSSIYVFR